MDIEKAVESLQEYWSTYSEQPFYKEYSKDTLINDALYGLGIAISDEYRYGKGYDRFKAELLEHLTTGNSAGDRNEK